MFFISSCVDPTELKCNMLKSGAAVVLADEDGGVDEDANNLVAAAVCWNWNWNKFELTRILKLDGGDNDDGCSEKEATVGIGIAANCSNWN